MASTIDITIPVEPDVAAILSDARNRTAAGHLLNRIFGAAGSRSSLSDAIAEAKVEARASGLTDAAIEAELAVYNAERRQTAAES